MYSSLCLLPSRYIRIVGVRNTVNKVFHLVCCEAYHTSVPFQLSDGLIGEYM